MKRLLLSLVYSVIPIITFSQVSTSPIIPNPYNELTIHFDATGSELENYTGDVYVHTGVTINDNHWLNVLGLWGDNLSQPKLTRDLNNANLYSLLLSPSVYSFFNVAASETISGIDLVFRSAEGDHQTRPDIFLEIPEYVSIPDANFEQSLIDIGIDSDKTINGQILRSDAEAVNELVLNNPLFDTSRFGNPLITTVTDKITDLTGIEAFVNLNKLALGYGSLTTVDLSNNKLLEDLFLNDNLLTSIDVSHNPLLKRFGVMRNPNIEILDVSKNILLEELFLEAIGISNIDLSKNLNLWRLQIQNNNLRGLDLSLHMKLTDVRVRYNASLSYLNVRNGNNSNMTGFDVRDTPSLWCVTADGTAVPDVSQLMFDFSGGLLSTDCGTVYIPDPNFEQALIDLGIDTDGVVNASVLRSDAEAVTELNVNKKNINSLQGIQAFTNLSTLYCQYNQIQVLDITNNTALTILECEGNQLTELNVTQNLLLRVLGFGPNNISEIDVSQNLNLEVFWCNNNNITSQNLDLNSKLSVIGLSNNPLAFVSLKNGNNVNVAYFEAYNTPNLACINSDVVVSASMSISGKTFSENCDEFVYIPDANFEQSLIDLGIDSDGVVNSLILRSDAELVSVLDLKNPLFAEVYGGRGNPLIINVTEKINALTGIQAFTNLKSLTCGYTNITEIDLSQNNSLTHLNLNHNQIESIDITHLTSLDYFSIMVNKLSAIDLSKNTELMALGLENNLLTNIDVSKNTKIEFISIGINQITSIDLSKNIDLTVISAEFSQLTTIDVSNNLKLVYFWVFECPNLNRLDVSKNTLLRQLGVWNTAIVALDLSNNPIDALNASNNPQLRYLDMRNGNNTNVSWFDLSNTPNLDCINADAAYSQVMTNSGKNFSEDCGDFVYIRDPNFEQALLDLGFDSDGVVNSLILKSDADLIIDLDLNNKNISSLAGIEHFVNLQYLFCHNNLLTELNLGNMPNLTILDCSHNALTSIDVLNYPNLVTLSIWGNQLTILDVSNNPNLEELQTTNNKLTSMDISANSKLKFMNFANNKLVNLNIANGNNANFTKLDWSDYSFDARWNPALMCIQVDADMINNIPSDWFKDEATNYNDNCPIINCDEFVAIPDANFEQALIDLGYDTNGLTGTIKKCDAASIIDLDLNNKNISSLSGIEHFVGLRYLHCNSNLLTELNLGNKPNLTNLNCDRNALTSIDVSNCPNLVSINVWNNQLITLDVSNNPSLEELICFSNKLTTMDISSNAKLRFMHFANNKLLNLNIANGNNANFSHPDWADYSFDARNNPALSCIQVDAGIDTTNQPYWFKDESASYNENCPTINCEELVAIPDTNFEQALVDLGIDTNGLTGDILKCDAAVVIDLDLNGKNISSLAGIEHFLNLRYLYCHNNLLTELNLGYNPYLINLHCGGNALENIDLSDYPNLISLHIYFNKLTSLDLSGNSKLEELLCYQNLIETIDVSGNSALKFLNFADNQLISLNIANGNNVNFSHPDWANYSFDARNNPKLNCIKIDAGIINNIPSDWFKDTTTSYSAASCESFPVLYVNDSDLSGDLYTSAIGSNANPGTAALPYATIQQAINNVSVGGVIYVDAGVYMEDVIVNKAVTLNGVQAGINPGSSLTRGTETIVVSVTEDPINRSVFVLRASDIAIDGFTIDGDTPMITGSVLLNGTDINAAFGIAKFVEPTSQSNLNIRNNIIKNFYRYGIFIQSTSEFPLSGNLISQNHFNNISAQNVDGNFGRWGRAIGLFNNAYASISQNVFTKVTTAVLASNFIASSIDNSFISGNIIESYLSGIEFGGFSSGANHYLVNNNAISTGNINTWNVPGASASNTNMGIMAYSISNTASQSFNNNTIINTQIGVLLANNISSIPNWAIHVNNNSITETIGYAIQNSNGNKVNATCNWYGDTAVQDNLNKITALTGYYVPFLTNGTDNDPITLGFQPVPDSCNGWPLLASVTSKTDLTCFEANDGSINISIDSLFIGKPPYTYLWTKDDEPAFSSSVEDPTNLSPGTYHLTITDGWGTNVLVDYNGNIINIDVAIYEPELLTASGNVTHNTCFGGGAGAIIVTALGGTAPYSYLWSTGGTEDLISNLTSGIYSVLITDANGCTSNTQYEVTQPTQIELQLTDLSTVCSNIATVSAPGGTGDYTYLWSNGATSSTINAVAAGTYNVIVTDTNGCIMTGSITLAVKEAFNPSASTTDVSCYGGTDGSIIIDNVNGQAPFSYSIDGINYIQDQNQFSNLKAGTYTIGVRDANDCTGFVTKTIGEPVPIVINVDNVQGTCAGASAGSISISTSGGSPGFSYSWTGPNGFTASSKNISNLASGTYNITVSDTKNCNTTISDIVVPTTSEIVVTETVNDISCKGKTNGSISLGVSGGSGNGFSYSWSVNGASGSSISNLTVGNYNVTITDIGTGCAVTKNYSITQPTTNVSISVSKINATGCNSMGKITITASGGTGPYYSYKLDGGEFGSANVFDNLQAGSYVAWVKDSNGCTNFQTVTITDNGSDVFEGNNSKNRAKPINVGITINARIGAATDVDWFSFDVPTGGGNYILNQNHESINYTFNLYPSSNLPALTPLNQSNTAKEYNLSAGKYYIQVFGGQSMKCYFLSVNPVIISAKNESNQTVNEISNETIKQEIVAPILLNAIAYPNPSSMHFTLKLKGISTETPVNVNVYDGIGRLVYTNSGSIEDEYQFGEQFQVGVYLVTVQQGSETVSLRVIKK